jgi:hypothetical protein
MRAAWLSVALLGGCAVDELPTENPNDMDVAQRTACPDLEGMTYRSVNDGECGLGPDGVALCHWNITFAAHDGTMSQFTWRHSDVGESGFVTCDGATIRSEDTRALEGHLDVNLDLVWDDFAYAPAP